MHIQVSQGASWKQTPNTWTAMFTNQFYLRDGSKLYCISAKSGRCTGDFELLLFPSLSPTLDIKYTASLLNFVMQKSDFWHHQLPRGQPNPPTNWPEKGSRLPNRRVDLRSANPRKNDSSIVLHRGKKGETCEVVGRFFLLGFWYRPLCPHPKKRARYGLRWLNMRNHINYGMATLKNNFVQLDDSKLCWISWAW